MKTLKAVFWDIDGTLADTEMEGHRLAFNKSFNKLGFDWHWSKNEYINLLKIGGGKNRIQKYSELKGVNLSKGNIDQIHLLKTTIYRNIINSDSIDLRTGVYRLVMELKKNKVKQFIVTTSSRLSAKALISNSFKSDLSPFDDMITSEDVHHQKPNPEPYLKAISLSGFGEECILAIEDSLIGMHSAIGAKLKCLITRNSWDNYEISDYMNATAVVDSLGDDQNLTNIIQGPSYSKKYIDFNYLEKLLLHQ